VLLDEIGAAALAHRWQQPRRVAHRCLLDLNDVRAHLGHEARHRWTGKILREIQHAYAGQHVPRIICACHFRSPAETDAGVGVITPNTRISQALGSAASENYEGSVGPPKGTWRRCVWSSSTVEFASWRAARPVSGPIRASRCNVRRAR